MVEAHIKTLTSSLELFKKRAYTSSMHRRSLHTMGFHGTQNKKSKMDLRQKLCFILHFLFLWSHFDFFVTSSISPKPKVPILCFICFMDGFSVCINCVYFQMKKIRTLKKNCIKNQGWKPIHQKYKTNESTNKHNPKKKWKQIINKK